MPPKASGSVEAYRRADGTTVYRARVRLADGTRERVEIPAKHSTDDRRDLYARALQEREDETGELLEKKKCRTAAKVATTTGAETILAYRGRLNEHREELGRGSGDASAWNAWIGPHLGGLPVAAVTRDEVETFRDMLDGEIAKHTRSQGAEGLSPKRALNVWSEVTTTFKAAVGAKRRDLRVRADNPCDGIEPPERGDPKRKTFLYPAELSAVLACGAVPLAWREVYAIGAYLYLRPGELRALTWGDVDLAAMLVHVTKAFDEREEETKAPKTRHGVRDVPIPAHLAPLLERMRRDRKATDLVAPILETLTENRRAVNLRADLQRAGCTRPRLTESTSTTMPVNFRSLRDSGITWLAIAGVDVVKIQRRCGHDGIETTMGYVKEAEDLTGGTIGEPFGPLPADLVAGVEPDGGGGSRQRIAARVRAKVRAIEPRTKRKTLKSHTNMEVRAGLVPHAIAETTAIQGGSDGEDPSRVDASARLPVAFGPAFGPTLPIEDGCDSPSLNPRSTLLVALGRAVADATAAGDLEAARVAHDALGRLLSSAGTAPAEVVELASRRRTP